MLVFGKCYFETQIRRGNATVRATFSDVLASAASAWQNVARTLC